MSRTLLRTLAFAGACAAAVAFTVPAAAAAPPRPTTTDPAVAAAGWLAQQFSNAKHQRVPSGDHIDLTYDLGQGPVYYYDGGATIDAAIALALTHTGGARIQTATTYVAKHLAEYAGYGGGAGTPYSGSLGKAALLAIVAGRDPNNFGGHHLLSELKADECASGSATCTPGSNSNVFSGVSTSYIVLAEARAGGTFAPSANLITYLESMQCPDGGFTSQLPPASCTSDVDATGYAVMALHAAAPAAASPKIAKAASWLAAERNDDGSWSSNGGKNIDSTGLAAAALRDAGRDATSSRAWLRTQQVTTGPTVGTGSRRGALEYQGAYDQYASIKGTSDAILGLVERGDLGTATAAGATDGYRVLTLDRPVLTHRPIRPGVQNTITGTGFAAGERVHVFLRQHGRTAEVGSSKANSFGTVRSTFSLPRGFTDGAASVDVRGSLSALTSATTVRVVGVTAPSSATSSPASTPSSAAPSMSAPILADTGRNGSATASILRAGLASVALGGALLLAGRRTRQGRHAR